MSANIIYSIIVPLYNEELVIHESYNRIKEIMDSCDGEYEIVMINDGSKDNTLVLAEEICRKDSHVKLLNFSRNFGHQVAITAGMDYAEGHAIIIIDADLQDPPEVILKMIEKWKEGYDVVYGQRIERKGETYFKKVTAQVYYRMLRSLTSIDVPVDTGDFRLIDRKVCNALKSLPERNRYVRGLVSWVGFQQTSVEYVREERFAGETKYPLKKMLELASNGVASFSYKPLKLATYVGAVMSIFSFLFLVVVILQKLFTQTTLPGWSSIVCINLFFNGLLFMMIGIIGEYIGRIYDEAKGRPLYLISKTLGYEKEISENEKTSDKV